MQEARLGFLFTAKRSKKRVKEGKNDEGLMELSGFYLPKIWLGNGMSEKIPIKSDERG